MAADFNHFLRNRLTGPPEVFGVETSVVAAEVWQAALPARTGNASAAKA